MCKSLARKNSHIILAYLLCLTAVTAAPATSAENEINDDSVNDLIDFSMYGERIYGEPDSETGILVSNYVGEEFGQNPEELGSYLEGDILIPTDRETPQRNGMLATSSRWPGAIVPYEIKGRFSTQELALINYAINEYHTKTCIRFRLRTTERDYISIVNDKSGCWSSVGRLGGKQTVNLQTPSCMRTYGTPIHELMHALGFFHEQNRHERDGFVRVLSENVKHGMMLNFEKSSAKTVYGFGVPYDYASVMHYSPTSFSINGKPTLMALRKTKESSLMGQRRGFSTGDIKKINAMYRCK